MTTNPFTKNSPHASVSLRDAFEMPSRRVLDNSNTFFIGGMKGGEGEQGKWSDAGIPCQKYLFCDFREM